MGTVLPAIGGVVLLLVAGIYWKVFKPKRDAKKAKEEKARADAAAKERSAELRTFVEKRILPKVPSAGISLGALLKLLQEEAIQAGGELNMPLFKDAKDFAIGKSGYLIQDGQRMITLGWKGREKIASSSKAPV